MKAYYFDNVEGDQRLPHFDERPVDEQTLERIGVKYWFIPIDTDGNWEQAGASPVIGDGGTNSSCERRSTRLPRNNPIKIGT